MINVTHCFDNISIKKEVIEPSFILTNRDGNYLYLGNKTKSRYQGFFIFDDFDMFRIIESINLDDSEIKQINNFFYYIERVRTDCKEIFLMPYSLNSLIYQLDKNKEIELFLDIKEAYDNREWGRNYEITKEGKNIIIKFSKNTDKKEDKTHGILEYSMYLVIRSENTGFKRSEQWVNHDYSIDKERNPEQGLRYVFSAIRLSGKNFVLSASRNKRKAIEECNYVFDNIENIKEKEKRIFYSKLDNIGILKDNELRISYLSALNSLNNLTINNNNYGILAGLPWFFQFWSRDAAISSKGVSLNVELTKKILFSILDTLNDKGRVQNIYKGKMSGYSNAADAAGWTFFRLFELYNNKDLNSSEIEYVKKNLLKSLKSSEEYITSDRFIRNDSLETWMDTLYKNDTRSGVRIEIQSLLLRMYNFAYLLTSNQLFKDREEALKKKVKQKFWKNNLLADGLDDFTIRPNIFLAAYIYPELLSKKEWSLCFENSFPSIWLEWGGLSTIDKSHPLFQLYHTGEDNRSYHRGDSWFWINNLSALVLYNLDKRKFSHYITKIIDASKNEILWSGAIGHHAEISSASRLESRGCLMQAWSSALYIELINKVYNL